FLELAATLVRIKAQLLLPRHGESEWDEDPRAELVRRLLEYEMFQEVARALDHAESERRRHFGKGYLPPRERPAKQDRGELTTTLDDLLSVAFDVPDPDPITTHVAPIRVVTVEEKIDAIHEHLSRGDRVLFSRLFRSWRERQHVVAALLACLEMAKQQLLRLEQVRRFGSIWLFGRSDAAASHEGRGAATEASSGPDAARADEAPDPGSLATRETVTIETQ
ncbi:MAG: segregation/condensation protein A, partial [Gemmatimonadetes bacterium]|nr:segregation/condensation protein A [Gemmatimonadota bacterium]